MARTGGRILIFDKKGENRGEILVQVNPFRLSVEMKTEEENQGLGDLLRIIGMETRGIPLFENGKISYITLDNGMDRLLEALTHALKNADLDACLLDDKGRKVKITCTKLKPESRFGFY